MTFFFFLLGSLYTSQSNRCFYQLKHPNAFPYYSRYSLYKFGFSRRDLLTFIALILIYGSIHFFPFTEHIYYLIKHLQNLIINNFLKKKATMCILHCKMKQTIINRTVILAIWLSLISFFFMFITQEQCHYSHVCILVLLFEVISGFKSVQIYDDNRNGGRIKIQLKHMKIIEMISPSQSIKSIAIRKLH